MKKLWVIAIVMLLMVSGCKSIIQEPEETDIPLETTIETIVEEEPIIEQPTESVLSIFNEMVKGNAKASELGLYIKDNIAEASTEEAEYMIEMLIIYQEELIQKMHDVIYNPGYMKALNQTMGGILDGELVDQIEDDIIREDYQNLLDAYLIIVRYEETPVVEVDWERINQLNVYFSEDFATLTRFYDKIQNYRYNRVELDVPAIAKDAYLIEQIILNNEKSFLTWQLEMLYERQVAALLIGPEGSYIGLFVDRTGKEYEALVDIVDEYPDAKLSDLIRTLNDEDNDDFQENLNLINDYNMFGLRSDNKLVSDSFIKGNDTYELNLISMPNNPGLEEKVNNEILKSTEVLKETMGGEGDYSFYSYPVFGNDKYFSMLMSVSQLNSQDNYGYLDLFLTIDLKTGKSVTLEEFIGKPFSEFKSEFERLKGITLNTMPEFYIDRRGITLRLVEEGEIWSNYAVYSIKELSSYIPLETFYK